jgi:hypothetical protein
MHESTVYAGFELAQILEVSRASARRHFDVGGPGDGVQRVDIIAFAHSVAANLREDDPRDSPLRDPPHQRVAVDGRSLLPAMRGDLRAAGVDARDDAPGEPVDDIACEPLVFHQQRAEDDLGNARRERVVGVLARANSAAHLDRDVDRRADALDGRKVLARAERAVEIDHMQPPRPSLDERFGALYRIAVVLGFGRGIALAHAHALTTA